ncbi:aspartic peptidase domain-containing protein [Xylariaceae sp. FL0255]|nr:aspartic peptidase domain-containing protein [Xylariaceae sp. FL0255]
MYSSKLLLPISLAWNFGAFSISAASITRSASSNNSLEAVVIGPSEYFEGNDGPWSTFDLRVGSSQQDIRVTISTASPESFVVLSQYGCTTAAFSTVPANCAVSRGNLFNPNDSTSWQEIGDYGINEDGVGLEANLGYSVNASVGLDKLAIGLTGPSLNNQIVAGIASAEPFYMGVFGLNNQPVNFSAIGNSTTPSFITTLKEQGLIPSISWSYTAGAIYRLKQVYGQLIFSGYDTSRFAENSATFTMKGDVTRDLVVVLQSISYSGSTTSVLLSDPIDIFIDSTDPNLWLPDDVCDAFEAAFGITLDETSGLYLLNDTQRTTLQNSNAQVTFRISDVDSGGDAVVITLPYEAFDLTAEYPLVDNTSYYFPLKRAANSTQYTLGRTFLQEAYLSADYERGVFNVSACVWNEGAVSTIVTIPPATSCASNASGCSSTPGSSSSPGSSPSKSLSGGSIAGIVIGALVAVLLILAVIIFFIRRQRKKSALISPPPGPDMAVITGPVHNFRNSPSTRTGKHYSPETLGLNTETEASEHNGGSNNGDSSQQELDAEDTEIHPAPEGEESRTNQGERMSPASHRPVYHELAGTEIRNDDDPDNSPFVSTLGTMGWQGEIGDASSDLVSPSTPVHHDTRL